MTYVNADNIAGHHMSGSGAQVPKALPRTYFQKATTPTRCVSTDRPNTVIIANDGGGDIGFSFEASASTTAGDYVNFGTAAGLVGRELSIEPTTWSGSAAASVVFIYRGN
tara:strand:- start:106 stop:435 length:330 start_codon:yes stop_codon:yes gene_type:complete